MNKQNLTTLLNLPQKEMSLQTLIEMLHVLEKYPYCSFLYAKATVNAKIIGRYDWKDFATKASIYTPDRKYLSLLVEQTPYKANPTIPKQKLQSSKKKKKGKEKEKDKDKAKNSEKSASVEFTLKLPPMPNIFEEINAFNSPTIPENPSKDELIEQFLNIDFPTIAKPNSEDLEETQPITDNQDATEFATETIAEVLVSQKKFSEAIKIYQRLSLEYPEKSATFASRITELKTLQ